MVAAFKNSASGIIRPLPQRRIRGHALPARFFANRAAREHRDRRRVWRTPRGFRNPVSEGLSVTSPRRRPPTYRWAQVLAGLPLGLFAANHGQVQADLDAERLAVDL